MIAVESPPVILAKVPSSGLVGRPHRSGNGSATIMRDRQSNIFRIFEPVSGTSGLEGVGIFDRCRNDVRCKNPQHPPRDAGGGFSAGNKQMVYWLYPDNQETYSYDLDVLDGDIEQMKPIDLTQDDGAKIRSISVNMGRALDVEFAPSRVQIGGPKRALADLYHGFAFFVDSKFKSVLEDLEPNIHQFIPIEFVWSDGTHASNKFWFVPCNRIDSLDRKKTTIPFGNTIWKMSRGGEMVFSRSQIGGRHAWVDKHMPVMDGVWISDVFAERLRSAGITGLGLRRYEDTE